MGGVRRQAGYLAAAGLFAALENNVNRLADDHERTQAIASVLGQQDYVEEVMPYETNILIFKLTDKYTNDTFLKELADEGFSAFGFGPQLIRFVTHLEFTDEQLAKSESGSFKLIMMKKFYL